ncbi:MAG: response regulator [Spirochaetota bacterium]
MPEDKKTVLIYGYGNPGRQDDGIGPALVVEIDRLGLSFVDTDSWYQLNIEDVELIKRYDLVIFLDTTVEDVKSFRVKKVEPLAKIGFTTHQVNPESIAFLCRELFGSSPSIWLIGVRGYNFNYIEGFSEKARNNYLGALDFLKLILRLYEERKMAERTQKTILIVDDDADIRASMRIVLEAAGFSVGEAGDAEEGLKVAEKVKPDAIIVDLMMETVDAGSKLSTQLKNSGYKGPIYLLSVAGDAVRYNIDAKELGLAGIFQKPINHELLITTLKTKLKVE